jgi:hypothetical protein
MRQDISASCAGDSAGIPVCSISYGCCCADATGSGRNARRLARAVARTAIMRPGKSVPSASTLGMKGPVGIFPGIGHDDFLARPPPWDLKRSVWARDPACDAIGLVKGWLVLAARQDRQVGRMVANRAGYRQGPLAYFRVDPPVPQRPPTCADCLTPQLLGLADDGQERKRPDMVGSASSYTSGENRRTCDYWCP